jgi:hypothetical protein
MTVESLIFPHASFPGNNNGRNGTYAISGIPDSIGITLFAMIRKKNTKPQGGDHV